MKKQRHLCFAGIFVFLAVILCLLPLKAQASNYVLNEVRLQVEQPYAGYKPVFGATILDEDAHYYIHDLNRTGYYNGVAWYDLTAGVYLDEDDVFIENHNYRVEIVCYTHEVYSFNASIHSSSATIFTTPYINGNAGTMGIATGVSAANQRGIAYYNFTDCLKAPAPITHVSVAGIQTPHHLAVPDRTATTSTSHVRVVTDASICNSIQGFRFDAGVAWTEPLQDGYFYMLDSTDTFEGGTTYQVMVLVEAVHPYRFAVDAQEQHLVSATLKGYAATVRDAFGYLDPTRYCLVQYEFPVTSLNNYCILSNIAISDIDAPVPGSHPDYTATVPIGAKLQGTDNPYAKNGIAWYDQSTGSYVSPTDTFIENHVYTVQVNMQAAEGYLFLDDENGNWLTTATVNGSTAMLADTHIGVDKCRADYTFPVCQKKPASKVDITISVPTAGGKASYTATLSGDGFQLQDRNDAYFQNGIAWWDLDENTYLNPGSHFVPGHRYQVEMYLVPASGYQFQNPAVTVNGQQLDVWTGVTLYVFREFDRLSSLQGWHQTDDGWMYWNADGTFKTGWYQEGNVKYYFNGIGIMCTSWLKLDGKEYCFAPNGALRIGWYLEAGIWRYLKPGTGEMAVGWLTISGKTYYFKSNGRMVTGSVEIDGIRYYFDSNGALVENGKIGWVQDNGKWYYYENGGKIIGWKQLGGLWYYLQADGSMVTGWQKIGNVWYFFKSSGAMATGWLQQGSVWYYLKPSGAMATGTVTIGDAQHQFSASGVWQGQLQTGKTGWVQESGKWYYYQNGAKKTGWLLYGSDWYYLKADGSMQTGWLLYGNDWYYFDVNGVMATGSVTLGGKTYNFNSSGICLNP